MRSQTYLARLQRRYKRLLVDQRPTCRVHQHNPILHLLELVRADDVSRGRIQSEIQTQHVRLRQELVEGDVGGARFEVAG